MTSTEWLQRMGGKITYDVFDDSDSDKDNDNFDNYKYNDNDHNIDNDFNRVVATDGRQNDTTRVNITVININDWDPRLWCELFDVNE